VQQDLKEVIVEEEVWEWGEMGAGTQFIG
jgi:hypothetical protein